METFSSITSLRQKETLYNRNHTFGRTWQAPQVCKIGVVGLGFFGLVFCLRKVPGKRNAHKKVYTERKKTFSKKKYMNPFPSKISSPSIKSGLLLLEENALIFFKVFPLDFCQFDNMIPN